MLSEEFMKNNQSVTYLVFENATLVEYFTLTMKPIRVNAVNFSNAIKHNFARVSKFNRMNNTYTLSAYLIAQIAKKFTNSVNEKL